MSFFSSRQSLRLSSFRIFSAIVFSTCLRPSVRFTLSVSSEPSDHLARGVPLKYFRFRPAACRLHLPNFGVIQLSAGRLLAASARLASSGSFLSRPSTCPALSFLSVVALMFPVRSKSFISALTIYPSYRCFSSFAVSVFTLI
jgi:hypothetical protein